jgi:hypothetical protein
MNLKLENNFIGYCECCEEEKEVGLFYFQDEAHLQICTSCLEESLKWLKRAQIKAAGL